ncbi:uncharacterized protein LOC133895017 [Phragmites australis]|uniref:uncharacterized protein LOC133895017 n=1 Tax=Phragmites australis TaxID=29695 RepID=UPI002D780A8C|nr:uncharacterized protein LOC133895017 [Phragmites australis]
MGRAGIRTDPSRHFELLAIASLSFSLSSSPLHAARSPPAADAAACSCRRCTVLRRRPPPPPPDQHVAAPPDSPRSPPPCRCAAPSPAVRRHRAEPAAALSLSVWPGRRSRQHQPAEAVASSAERRARKKKGRKRKEKRRKRKKEKRKKGEEKKRRKREKLEISEFCRICRQSFEGDFSMVLLLGVLDRIFFVAFGKRYV